MNGAPDAGWEMHTIAPGTAGAWHVEAGGEIRLIDLEGSQTGDLFLVAADDVTDGLSNGRTFDYGGTLTIGTGSTLYSRRSRPLATITADDVGRHDFLYAPCSTEMYVIGYGLDDHPNCYDNLSSALAAFGVPPATVHVAFNYFMATRIEPSGALVIDPPLSKAGDTLTLRLERECFVAVTSCPASISNGVSPQRWAFTSDECARRASRDQDATKESYSSDDMNWTWPANGSAPSSVTNHTRAIQ